MTTIMMTCVFGTRATEVIPHQSQSFAYNENNKWNFGEQMINVRHWMKSLASEWSSSESDTHGKFNCVNKIISMLSNKPDLNTIGI